MNIEFYTSHMETLRDLQNMAEKHGCQIHFGFKDYDSEELDYDDLYRHKVPKSIANRIMNEDFKYDDIDVTNIKTSYEDLWFELYDPNNTERHYHCMSYREITNYFEIEKGYDFDEWDDKNQKFIDWCDEHQCDWNADSDKWIFNLHNAPTVINGFQYKKEHTDGRVYRSGMALHYFAELVCKYLKEPMISRTY